MQSGLCLDLLYIRIGRGLAFVLGLLRCSGGRSELRSAVENSDVGDLRASRGQAHDPVHMMWKEERIK